MTRTYVGFLTGVASGLREMLPRMASQAATISLVASGFTWPYTRPVMATEPCPIRRLVKKS
jgi:hypothetical protein